MKRTIQSLFLAAAIGLGFAITSPANALVITFDENGNCTWDIVTAGCSGSLQPDPSNGGVPALTYSLAALGSLVGNGDVGVLEFGSLLPPYSDGIRFTDALGALTGQTADRLIFYSTDSLGELADTGLPANFGGGTTGGPATENANGTFTYVASPNVYNGVSAPIPEPATIALLGAGLLGLGAMRRRRKAKA